MRLIYAKGNWEVSNQPLEAFIAKTAEAGFDATEVFLPARPESTQVIRDLHHRSRLRLIAHVNSVGRTPDEHIASFRANLAKAAECEPIAINSHTGRDIFSFEDNLRIFAVGQEFVQRTGIPLYHETHRSRPLFSGPSTTAVLRAMPDLLLTADFSHWMCVHESDLSDQPENVALAINQTRHIHARVGFAEGPQIADPRAPEWKSAVELSLGLWKRIIDSRRRAGDDSLTITPEFGPPPYMPTIPHTNQPVADAWEVNCWMLRFLKERLS